jgi:hypothetical protein
MISANDNACFLVALSNARLQSKLALNDELQQPSVCEFDK